MRTDIPSPLGPSLSLRSSYHIFPSWDSFVALKDRSLLGMTVPLGCRCEERALFASDVAASTCKDGRILQKVTKVLGLPKVRLLRQTPARNNKMLSLRGTSALCE